MSERAVLLLHLAGWLLFLVCAILFIVSGVQSGDRLLVIGSVVFLLGCLAFLVPLVAGLRGSAETDPTQDQRGGVT